MLEIRQLKVRINEEYRLDSLIQKALDIKSIKYKGDTTYTVKILRQSLDARKKTELFNIYTVGIIFEDSKVEKLVYDNNKRKKKSAYDITISSTITYNPLMLDNSSKHVANKNDFQRPVIVGFGPAGMFCAYILALNGLQPIILERGESVDARLRSVERFFNNNELNTESNVQFGEGGAGTFSDGKLNTLTKDKYGRQEFVLESFVRFGANENITYSAKPHIGTDILKNVVKNIREEIINLGGTFYFNTKVNDIDVDNNKISGVRTISTLRNSDQSIDLMSISTNHLVMAIGHSARDTFEMLNNHSINMEPKPFAVGFRVVHPQELINKSQYGEDYPESLEAAPYKVTNTAENGRRVYSFCMCPGGYVVNASSEKEGICVNGMSYSKRDNKYANSAIIIGVDEADYITGNPEHDHSPLKGMYYQRMIENKAYKLGKGCVPSMSFGDFEKAFEDKALDTGNKDSLDSEIKKESEEILGFHKYADLTSIYENDLNQAFIESMHRFGRIIKGFDTSEAMMYGIEARTSSPVRINRDESFNSNIKGIYPCGEGAGYAGGIMSAAVDGIKVAEAIIRNIISE